MTRFLLVAVLAFAGHWPVAALITVESIVRWWWHRPSARARAQLTTQAAGLARMRIFLHATDTGSRLGLDREALGVLLVQMGQALERGRAPSLPEGVERE